MIDLLAPLPDDWNDAAFDLAHRRLKTDPKSLTDSDLVMFLTAHGATFAENAQRARSTASHRAQRTTRFSRRTARGPRR